LAPSPRIVRKLERVVAQEISPPKPETKPIII